MRQSRRRPLVITGLLSPCGWGFLGVPDPIAVEPRFWASDGSDFESKVALRLRRERHERYESTSGDSNYAVVVTRTSTLGT